MALGNVKASLDNVKDLYIRRDNNFYRHYYHYFLIGMMGLIVLLLAGVIYLNYQMTHRPLPQFTAQQANGKKMTLTPFEEPNLLPDTIIRFASKAATLSYSFNFANYNSAILLAKPYFTEVGWTSYMSSLNSVIKTIVLNKVFVDGVVYAPPVISNQGPLPGLGYTWRVQVPFLVTYLAGNILTKRKYYVILTIVKVPTSTNPQGIGINQFVMV